jgi:hypothetical protein
MAKHPKRPRDPNQGEGLVTRSPGRRADGLSLDAVGTDYLLPTARSRLLGITSLLCLFGLLGLAEWSVDKHCRQTQDCNRHQEANRTGDHQGQNLSLWYPISPLDRYTLLLVVFSAGLTGASIWQGFFLLRADNTARTTADAALKGAMQRWPKRITCRLPQMPRWQPPKLLPRPSIWQGPNLFRSIGHD